MHITQEVIKRYRENGLAIFTLRLYQELNEKYQNWKKGINVPSKWQEIDKQSTIVVLKTQSRGCPNRKSESSSSISTKKTWNTGSNGSKTSFVTTNGKSSKGHWSPLKRRQVVCITISCTLLLYNS